jgi:hypothetical protein
MGGRGGGGERLSIEQSLRCLTLVWTMVLHKPSLLESVDHVSCTGSRLDGVWRVKHDTAQIIQFLQTWGSQGRWVTGDHSQCHSQCCTGTKDLETSRRNRDLTNQITEAILGTLKVPKAK